MMPTLQMVKQAHDPEMLSGLQLHHSVYKYTLAIM